MGRPAAQDVWRGFVPGWPALGEFSENLIARKRVKEAHGFLRRSEACHRAAIEKWRKPGGVPAELAAAYFNLGLNLKCQRRFAEAEQALREYLAVYKALPSAPRMPMVANSLLSEIFTELNRLDEAEPLLVTARDAMDSQLPLLSPRTRDEATMRLVRFYERRNDPAKAAQWRAKLVLPARE